MKKHRKNAKINTATEGVNIELRHNEVDAILNDPPIWLVRVGSYMIYGLVIIIISVAAIIKYPDTIISEIEISENNAIAKIPYTNVAMRLKENVAVNIEIDNYPAHQFGLIKASISKIEWLSNSQEYQIYVSMPNPIVLSGGEHINSSGKLKGKAIFILDNKSLLQRVLETF